ncbi:aldose epimerase family protein [Aquimarina algiphila]|uniref:aldose epimerase family protein n=1 Tax=Aquimarina algiphila TaxID=2047982 RepID=UPI0024923C64|nr:aldose epimerase family protein [Aquimarina algiphila]
MGKLKTRIQQKSFGFHNQKEVFILSIKNNNGMQLQITNFAATITSLEVPDIEGELVNVVVGFDTLQDYITKSEGKESKFLGASVGRYAGRISKGKIIVGGIEYQLHNEQGVHLHGGRKGFDEKVWEIDDIDEEELSVSLSYYSEHMEEGYPGALGVKVTYQLTDDNELNIIYQAISDQDTIINLTNHAYYNLSGENTIADHELKLNCSTYLEVDKKHLPTGKIQSVANTKYDFLVSRKLDTLEEKGIIDDAFIFDKEKEAKVSVYSPKTGIQMDVYTNQPAVVIYTLEEFPDWNFRNGVKYGAFPSICFETQNYPDAPNHEHFPSALLKAKELYKNSSTFKFSIAKNIR